MTSESDSPSTVAPEWHVGDDEEETTAGTESAGTATRSTADPASPESGEAGGGSVDGGSPVLSDAGDWVGAEDCDLPPDVVFDVLKNQRRRLVLQFLRETEGRAKLGTLAEHIAAYENDVAPSELNAQQRKRVYIGLYQCHLPKLADADVIDFDQDRGVLDMNESGEALLAFLDADDESGDAPWPYLGVVLLGGAAFVGTRFFLPVWVADVVVLGLLAAMAVFAVTRSRAE